MTSVNVIIDLNQYFYRWVHYLLARNKNRVFLEQEGDDIELIQGIHSSIQGDLFRYKNHLDRLFLCADSPKYSWRKYIKVEGEKFYKSVKKEYKFDHKKLIRILQEYCDILKKKGIYIMSFDHAEGDDMIYFLSDTLYEQGDSSVIISSDSDLKQLIKSEDDKFIYIFDSDRNKRKHFVDKYISKTYKDAIASETVVVDSMDNEEDYGGIFDHPLDEMQSEIADVILNNIYDVSDVIDPCKVILVKMLAGDKNDGVPACYQYYLTKNSAKTVSFTELRANSIWEKYAKEENYDYQYFVDLFNDVKLRRRMACKVLSEVKSEDLDKIDVVTENIKRNLKFIFLHEMVYHQEHKENLLVKMNKILDDEDFVIKHKKLMGNGFGNTLLEGTPYEFSNDESSRYYDSKTF